ncbi:protein NUCLEAR FUSION DEFECTIVE 6, mitochondrial isoform X2 [Hibiscus syriacus]|uniref:protein NUCLEAR FUSION DEFECTIVE 6, mitochondrial isoform X2 n=1 Tax=Hibiscus syriacus TaxID=106335 RepID=UPI001924B33B|nr:protein NUCLEAR FUSION DEFECTIVE 6, mitochondrial isoform X2 [Hibiscus syriacus]
MASFAATVAGRSVFRSSSVRKAAARLAPQAKAKAAPAPLGLSSRTPLSNRIFRCPVEASFCVESMLPYHSATASALMTSMLSISRSSYVWLPEGQDNTR